MLVSATSINGKMRDGSAFTTVRVEDPELTQALEAQKVEISGASGKQRWWNPIFTGYPNGMNEMVVLAPLTLEEQRAFAADYADYLVDRGEVADPVAALARAQAEIEPEVEAAVQAGEGFWAVRNAEGATVGWLWVKGPLDELPPSAAFLYQILVKGEFRRQGYGTAMLAALEEVLAAAGRSELRLNVWDTNEAARRLYERAGYELVKRFPGKRQVHKRLACGRA